MNKVKKIIALIMVIFVVIRVYVFSVSASFAAPFIAEETLKTVLIEGMLAGGADYTKDDLESWKLEDLENEFEIQMTTNPNFKSKKVLPVFFDINDPGTGYNEEAAAFDKMANKVVSDWFNNMIENGGELYDFLNPTYSDGVDMQGGVSVFYSYDFNDPRYYTVYYSSQPGQLYYDDSGNLHYYIEYDYREFHNPYGEVRHQDYSSGVGGTIDESIDAYYGKWILAGEEINVGGEEIPVIGEADGTQVTPDMLNPDGTVTIDGTTYSPSDYIDWEKFKDDVVDDLLKKLMEKIADTPVIDDSKTDIDEIDSDVTLPSELSDFSTPGLIDLFPFCLPKHFIRGMYLFSAEPEVPHFETEIEIPAFLNVPAQKWKFEIDFKEFEPLAKITRWCSLISFIYCLILLTPKIAKGA